MTKRMCVLASIHFSDTLLAILHGYCGPRPLQRPDKVELAHPYAQSGLALSRLIDFPFLSA